MKRRDASGLDVVFLSSGDAAEDAQRLDALPAGEPIARLIAVARDETGRTALAARLADAPWPHLVLRGAKSSARGANRAILLRERDVVLVPPGVMPHPGCLEELIAVAKSHDRVAAAVPFTHDGSALGASERWPEKSALFASSEIPVPDIGFVLMRDQVLKLAGALDPAFANLAEALADWCLRAQRLGFVTLRAMRAPVRVDRFETVRCPITKALDSRHRSLPRQRWRADTDFTARLSRKSLAVGRGPLSVCLDGRHLPVDAINGTGVYAVELAKALQAFTPARVSWLVGQQAQKDALASLAMPVYLEEQTVPETHVVHRPAQVFQLRDLRWLLCAPAPFVVTFQDLVAYRAGSAHHNGEGHELYQVASSLAVRSAQGIIAISKHNASEIVREFHVPEDRVRVVYHGVHADHFAVRDAAKNTELLEPLGVKGPYFLVVGSDYAHKNLRLVLAAFARLRALWGDASPAPELVLVGHPSGTTDGVFPRMRRSAPGGVRFLGDVSGDALRALYQEGLALLYLSTYEGFGLPVLEAMAAGTPVLCSRLSSIPEVGGDAVEYADELTDTAVARQLLGLATDEARRKALIEKGCRQVAKFTWEKTAKETFQAYERALCAPSTRSVHERRANRVLIELLCPS